MKCEVIHIRFDHPSFSWGSGLYAVLSEDDYDLHLVKLDEGLPQMYDDGRYMETITVVGNSGITRTQLIFETDKKIHERTLKLTKLLKNEHN